MRITVENCKPLSLASVVAKTINSLKSKPPVIELDVKKVDKNVRLQDELALAKKTCNAFGIHLFCVGTHSQLA